MNNSNSAAGSNFDLVGDDRLRVAVLMGGSSSERSVSLATGSQIVQSLCTDKYRVKSIDTADLPFLASPNAQKPALTPGSGKNEINNLSANANRPDSDAPGADSTGFIVRADVVFIALHGKGGEDGSVQGLLEIIGLPYTGSGVLASALAMNKTMCKRLLASQGIPVIEGITVHRPEWSSQERKRLIKERIVERIGFPTFIKPNSEGSTFGCSLAEDEPALEAAIDNALTYDSDVLIERYTRGIEITVGVLEEANGELKCLTPVEIVPKAAYYNYESKYADGGSEHIIPARIEDELTSLARSYAARCHELLGCRGMSRTDMIATEHQLYILEVNTIPGLTPTSLLPQAAAHDGISFPELLDRMIDSAMRRKG